MNTGIRARRIINIEIWDSNLAYSSYVLENTTKLVNGRNPFLQNNSGQINYDIDSEEELADLMGENIGEEDLSVNQEPEASELYEEGFIVDSDISEEDSEESTLPVNCTE